jgi:light-regulated signal transduction histidine kinase (bacteriophytochrome)
MNEEEAVEVEVTDLPTTECEPEITEETVKEKVEAKKDKASHHLKDALRQVESFGQALSEALQGRGNVVMVRVNDEALSHLDMLVEAEITKSRSESAAFLINEGISANEVLFDRIRNITEQIAELREQLRHEVKLEPEVEPGLEPEPGLGPQTDMGGDEPVI